MTTTCNHCDEPIVWDATSESWVNADPLSSLTCSATGGHYSDDEVSTTYTFTITASFDASTKQEAWDEWCEWLRHPSHVEDGTVVQPAEPNAWESLSPEAQASWLRGMAESVTRSTWCDECGEPLPADSLIGATHATTCSLYSDDEVCNTCGGTGVWETTFEDEPTTLVSLGPCPDCGSH